METGLRVPRDLACSVTADMQVALDLKRISVPGGTEKKV